MVDTVVVVDTLVNSRMAAMEAHNPSRDTTRVLRPQVSTADMAPLLASTGAMVVVADMAVDMAERLRVVTTAANNPCKVVEKPAGGWARPEVLPWVWVPVCLVVR